MRHTDHPQMDSQFIERWSPRSFLNNPISEDNILTIFEAARWAPSCYNEQPWLFVYARTDSDRAKFLEALVEINQSWAIRAPLLVFAFARTTFAKNGKDNRWAEFDTGAACLSLALQAGKLGYFCHPMAGFLPEKAHEVCAVPTKNMRALCALAFGERGPAEALSDPLREMEAPNQRRELSTLAFESAYRP